MAKVSFRAIDVDDLDMVRTWRNLPRIRDNMYDNTIISAQQQQQWFGQLIKDDSKIYLLCLLDDVPVGTLYFTNISGQTYEWGCYIGAERILPGLGLVLAASALNYAFKQLNAKLLLADVLMFNIGPQKMHKLFRYQQLENSCLSHERDGKKLQVCHYQYNKNDWLSNQTEIYRSLPKNLVKVIENVKFI